MLNAALQTTRGRLVVLLGAVAVIVLGSAALAHFAFDLFATYGDALWSATLHLLDPSSLHDDEGAAARTIGVFQVVTGLVLLVGLLFTFVSETVGSSLECLGQRDRGGDGTQPGRPGGRGRAGETVLPPARRINGPCTRLRNVVSRHVRRGWLESGSPAAPAASA